MERFSCQKNIIFLKGYSLSLLLYYQNKRKERAIERTHKKTKRIVIVDRN